MSYDLLRLSLCSEDLFTPTHLTVTFMVNSGMCGGILFPLAGDHYRAGDERPPEFCCGQVPETWTIASLRRIELLQGR